MSSDIALFKTGTIAKTDDDFNAVAKAGDWIPRVQLFGSGSKEVKSGKIAMAHYGLVRSKENIDDVGAQFDCVPIDFRTKAMRIGGEGVESFYDVKKDEFKKIMADSEIKDSGCMYGPEFLIWLPVQKTFATLFFNNPTMRRESPNMRQLISKAATCKAKLIENKRFSWHGPVIVPCSTPVTSLPDKVAFEKELERFRNPKDSEVETVAPSGRAR